MQLIELLKQFLKKEVIANKNKKIKKRFNKNFIMSTEDEERVQSSNKCWICNELFDAQDDKVRDHCHITVKYRGSAHWSCNVNFKLTKKVPVIFYNLKGFDSHLIMQENDIGKFDVKVSVIPSGLVKTLFLLTVGNL